jgi:hypothetical protein
MIDFIKKVEFLLNTNTGSTSLARAWLTEVTIQSLHEIEFESLSHEEKNILCQLLQRLEAGIDNHDNYQAINDLTAIFPFETGAFYWFKVIEKANSFVITVDNWITIYFDLLKRFENLQDVRHDVEDANLKGNLADIYVTTLNQIFCLRLETFGISTDTFKQEILLHSRVNSKNLRYILNPQCWHIHHH